MTSPRVIDRILLLVAERPAVPNGEIVVVVVVVVFVVVVFVVVVVVVVAKNAAEDAIFGARGRSLSPRGGAILLRACECGRATGRVGGRRRGGVADGKAISRRFSRGIATCIVATR